MKKLFLSSLCAAALLTACNSEEPVVGPVNGGELGEPQFLTVNLVTNTTNGTRAVAGDPEGAEYEAGLEAENKVSKVRFYFFKANGDAALVRNDNGTKRNWLDWENISEEGADMPNVEKILSATLVIQSPKGDVVPSQIVAIINPTEAPVAERSLSSLGEQARDYKTFQESGKFVMSNSTYNDGGMKMAVSVEGKLKPTSGEALNDPVQIYVERTVAKVRLGSNLEAAEGTNGLYKTSTAEKPQTFTVYDENGQNPKTEEIFVKFLGWNTTAVSDLSRLVKKINVNWDSNILGTNPWNWAEYKRSFWAINADGVKYQYGAFEVNDKIDDNLFAAQAKKNFDKSDWVYVNENATDFANETSVNGDAPGTPTKVIIGAQLVDKAGNPLEIAEYGSTRTSVSGLKLLFANNCGLYKKDSFVDEADGKTKQRFTKIEPADLKIVTATQVGKADAETPGRYKSYVQIGNTDETWYASNAEDAQPITLKEANDHLLALGSAKVWTEGYTYYFFDIKHLGGKNGVVRNHIYDANVNSLAGLGTPVYDPNEIIYPEKPKDDNDTYIAAQINILSWRVVNNDADLDWNN